MRRGLPANRDGFIESFTARDCMGQAALSACQQIGEIEGPVREAIQLSRSWRPALLRRAIGQRPSRRCNRKNDETPWIKLGKRLKGFFDNCSLEPTS